MKRRVGGIMALTVLPCGAAALAGDMRQDVNDLRQDQSDIWKDKQDIGKDEQSTSGGLGRVGLRPNALPCCAAAGWYAKRRVGAF